MDNGAAVRTLAGDRDHAHGLGGQGDVRQGCSDHRSCGGGHRHAAVQHHWRTRKNQLKANVTLQVNTLLCGTSEYHLSWPELRQWLQQACRLLR